MLEIPEIIVIGNVEFLFAGMAFALGFPRLGRKILRSRYGPSFGMGPEERQEGGE